MMTRRTDLFQQLWQKNWHSKAIMTRRTDLFQKLWQEELTFSSCGTLWVDKMPLSNRVMSTLSKFGRCVLKWTPWLSMIKSMRNRGFRFGLQNQYSKSIYLNTQCNVMRTILQDTIKQINWPEGAVDVVAAPLKVILQLQRRVRRVEDHLCEAHERVLHQVPQRILHK